VTLNLAETSFVKSWPSGQSRTGLIYLMLKSSVS